jgi:hypothetical protein
LKDTLKIKEIKKELKLFIKRCHGQ